VALNSLGLGFVFTARDMASGQIGNLARNFSGLDQAALRANASYQRNLGALGASAAILGTGVVTLAGAYAAATRAGTFEQEVQRIGAIAQSSSDQVDMLREAAIGVGLSTKFTPDQAVQGFQALASSGFNASQSLDMLNSTLGFAAAGNVSIEQSAQSIAAAVNVFGLAGDAAEMVGDQFVRISNATNLTGADMQIAMSNVGRGAQLTGQSIEEMLPALGLMVDAGKDASVAGTAVSSALQFMSNNAEGIKSSLGVDVVETLADGTQRFRPFMEIAYEAGEALAGIQNPAERAALATELFGRFGVSAVTDVYGRLSGRGVSDANNNVLHGAEAMNFLRTQMTGAAGAAEEFSNRVLDTFAGQQQQLAASTETLGIVVGEAFAPVFRPLVEGILGAVRMIAEGIRSMPAEFRTMIGRFVVGIGVVLTIAGAFMAMGAAIAIVGPFMASAASAAAGLFVALLPYALLFVGIAGAAYMLKRAIDENVGGIGDTFRQLWSNVSLVFRAMGQIIGQGYLSGEVAEEFGAAGAGVQGFIETFHALYVRAQEFGAGISAGIDAAVAAMGPTLDAAGAAFDRLAEAMGFAGDAVDTAATTPLERFATVGAAVGAVIGDVLTWVLDFGRVLMDIGSGAIAGFSEGWEASGVSLDAVGDALSSVWDKIVLLGESLGIVNNGTSESASGWSTFGEIVGNVLGFVGGGIVDLAETAIVIFGVIVDVVRFVINIFVTLWETVKFVGQLIAAIFFGIRDAFMLVVDGLIAGLGRMAMALPESIRPEWMNGLIREGGAATARIETRANEADNRLGELGSSLSRSGEETYGPTQEQERNRAREAELQAEATARALQGTGARRDAARQQTTVIQVDGREIARAVSESGAIMSEESFTPAANMSMAPGV
jgi:TP901 family phage tail tape measure protein